MVFKFALQAVSWENFKREFHKTRNPVRAYFFVFFFFFFFFFFETLEVLYWNIRRFLGLELESSISRNISFFRVFFLFPDLVKLRREI